MGVQPMDGVRQEVASGAWWWMRSQAGGRIRRTARSRRRGPVQLLHQRGAHHLHAHQRPQDQEQPGALRLRSLAPHGLAADRHRVQYSYTEKIVEVASTASRFPHPGA